MKKFICKFIVLIIDFMLGVEIGRYYKTLMINYPEDKEKFLSQINETKDALINDTLNYMKALEIKSFKGFEYELTFSFCDYLYSIMDQIRERLA